MDTRSEHDLEDSTDKLLQELKEVVEDGEELLRTGASELSEKGLAARAKLSAALDTARETGRKIQQQAVAGARATDRVIREHPYQSIGVALGIGLLIGILINRK